ncbi:hypothetical protein O3P69_010722 [Scylla paramamosain]|uniref:Ig-like domain-containing protein n=1 Tax=Scylla paramamosain TaxID=85552 RepID=A0AAW0TEP9_SCYPA
MLEVTSEGTRRSLPWYAVLWVLVCGGRGAGGQHLAGATYSVTATRGTTAHLPCLVPLLVQTQQHEVTWLRRHDLHILTSGTVTFSPDARFKVSSSSQGLEVRGVTASDAGEYQCYVTKHPRHHFSVTLHVTERGQAPLRGKRSVFVANNTAETWDGSLKVKILGGREVNIEAGSLLTLTCRVTSSHGPATLIYWYHNTALLRYSSPRGGVKLKIDHANGVTLARLEVGDVRATDSGVYSCVPPGSHPASVLVHVHHGEQDAAVQQERINTTTSSSSLISLPPHPVLLLPTLTLFFLYFLSSSSSYPASFVPLSLAIIFLLSPFPPLSSSLLVLSLAFLLSPSSAGLLFPLCLEIKSEAPPAEAPPAGRHGRSKQAGKQTRRKRGENFLARRQNTETTFTIPSSRKKTVTGFPHDLARRLRLARTPPAHPSGQCRLDAAATVACR